MLSRLGARRSAWNAADIRGEVERIVAAADIIAPASVRHELAEDLSSRAIRRCVPLLDRKDVPEHIRNLTSRVVLDVEADLTTRLTTRAERSVWKVQLAGRLPGHELDQTQGLVAGVSATAHLMVIEGAAGAG